MKNFNLFLSLILALPLRLRLTLEADSIRNVDDGPKIITMLGAERLKMKASDSKVLECG